MMSFSGSKGSDLDNFYKIREQVSQRASQVKSGLTRCGLKTVDMGTEELIELYYSILNPGGESKSIM
jgi:hypothetical protein